MALQFLPQVATSNTSTFRPDLTTPLSPLPPCEIGIALRHVQQATPVVIALQTLNVPVFLPQWRMSLFFLPVLPMQPVA